MPRRTPLPDWTGEDVHLIGGGPSLKRFDWTQLKSLNTIGCNQAFELGPSICQIATFGDLSFWESYAGRLAKFRGWVAPLCDVGVGATWLHRFNVQGEGLSVDPGMVAWNGNTGAAAINLALLLGAQRVYLLGYDCGSSPDATHWHGRSLERQLPYHYNRFAEGFLAVADQLPLAFPGRQVINVTDGASRLRAFPRSTFANAGLRPPPR